MRTLVQILLQDGTVNPMIEWFVHPDERSLSPVIAMAMSGARQTPYIEDPVGSHYESSSTLGSEKGTYLCTENYAPVHESW